MLAMSCSWAGGLGPPPSLRGTHGDLQGSPSCPSQPLTPGGTAEISWCPMEAPCVPQGGRARARVSPAPPRPRPCR